MNESQKKELELMRLLAARMAATGIHPPKDPTIWIELWNHMAKGAWVVAKHFDNPKGSMLTLCREDEPWQQIYARIDRIEGLKNE